MIKKVLFSVFVILLLVSFTWATTTTTTNFGFPKPPLGAAGQAAGYNTLLDSADAAIKSALDGKLATGGNAAKATLWGTWATIAGPLRARTYTFPDTAATMVYQHIASVLLGTASSATGSAAFYNSGNANAFTIQPGATGAALSWTLPIAAPGGNGYLVTASTAGVLTYTDPSTLGGGGGGAGAWGSITSKPEITVGDTGYATLAAAVTAIGATPTTLVLPTGNHVSGGVTVPSTLGLKYSTGAISTVADATTFTVNGPVESGRNQIFNCSGSGAVIFGAPLTLFPEWWGCAGNGSTDDFTPMKACLAALPEGGICDIGSKSYAIGTAELHLPTTRNGYTLRGTSPAKSKLIFTYANNNLGSDGVVIYDGLGGSSISNITVENIHLPGLLTQLVRPICSTCPKIQGI